MKKINRIYEPLITDKKPRSPWVKQIAYAMFWCIGLYALFIVVIANAHYFFDEIKHPDRAEQIIQEEKDASFRQCLREIRGQAPVATTVQSDQCRRKIFG